MNFTKEHIRILEKNRPYYDGLVRNGTVRNMSSVIVDEFQKVYKEAIGNKKFAVWCDACIVELMKLVYINYDNFKKEEGSLILSALNY